MAPKHYASPVSVWKSDSPFSLKERIWFTSEHVLVFPGTEQKQLIDPVTSEQVGACAIGSDT